jgi:hypothetical protein
MNRTTIVLAALLALGGCRCNGPERGATGGAGADQAAWDVIAPAPDAEPVQTDDDALAVAEDAAAAAREESPEDAERAPLRWGFTPATLDVYRDTRVTFRVEDAGALPSGWTFEWTFGDGAPPQTGARVEHDFRGGQADYLASLTVRDGDRTVYVGTRKVPLERLPVVPLGEPEDRTDFAPDLSIPPPPEPGETSFRFVVISDSNGPYGSIAQGTPVPKAVASIVGAVRPELVVHNGDMVAGQRADFTREHLERMWEGYHEAITQPLLLAGIPLAPVAGNHDASPNIPREREMFRHQWRRPAFVPELTFVADRDYPIRYTFTHKGALFVVMDGASGRVEEGDLRWLRTQLESAKIYTARFVFSHVPLHKFTDAHFGDVVQREEAHEELRRPAGEDELEYSGLDKHFRVYNLFLETNVTMLFSGHYEVYYKGRYGALRVVSTGNIAGTRRALSGQDRGQGPSYVVVDVVGGRPKHVFAVRGPDFRSRFDESELPSEVEVYTYDPTYTPGAPDLKLPTGIIEEGPPQAAP